MKFRRQSKEARGELKRRGIAPAKQNSGNRWGQASGGWSPFAAPAGRQNVADDVEYDAFDRARGHWFTHKPGR